VDIVVVVVVDIVVVVMIINLNMCKINRNSRRFLYTTFSAQNMK